METFSKEEMNSALLGMYVGTRGPKTLRKCITDKLFTYQMWRNEESIRQQLDAEMVLLVFPESRPVPSLDELDDIIVQDISSLAFGLSKNENDTSKLRSSIQGMLDGTILQKYLQSREQQFRRKNNKVKLLSRNQFARLYPRNGKSNIYELDISVLCFILFEGMGFRPISDFDKLPLASVITEADDMLRIKICRDVLVHQTNAEMSDEDFESHWECLTGAFERLLNNRSVRKESERLKSLTLPDDKVEQCRAMVQRWRMDEQEDPEENEVTHTTSHTEAAITSNETKIVENNNEKHEEVVNLSKKNSTKRRKAQNKEIKKSFPVRVHGYDKFKQLCHIMHEAGIRYTLPTPPSTDTNTPTDTSPSPKNYDRDVLQFEVDSEDGADKQSVKLRRSRSLPRYKSKQSNDGQDFDTANSNMNKSTGSAGDNLKVAENRPPRQWKRNLSEKCRSSSENRSPRPGNSIRMGVRSYNDRKLALRNAAISQENGGIDYDRLDARELTLLDATRGHDSRSGHVSERSDDLGDPTGYFLSLQRRDEYIHSSPDSTPVKSHGNSRSKHTPIETCLSNVEEEEENTSQSATSGEYVLGEEEAPTKRVPDFDEKNRLSAIKNEMYSEDSTGYSTDLPTINSSIDGNTSSDTLLFRPVRPPTAHTSHNCGIHAHTSPNGGMHAHTSPSCGMQTHTSPSCGMQTHTSPSCESHSHLSPSYGSHGYTCRSGRLLVRTSPSGGIQRKWVESGGERREQIYHLSFSPRSIPSTADDGYASNGYPSSLDRNSPITTDQYRILQNKRMDDIDGTYMEREDTVSQDELSNKESNLNIEAETLLKLPVKKKRKRVSISSCFRNCLFCGYSKSKEPDQYEKNSRIEMDSFRERRESERYLLSSCNTTASPDLSLRMDGLSDSCQSDSVLRLRSNSEDRPFELEEIFV
ncbi:uncharacterized protein [Argopecten irradians]|uniref:uncharacterized protein isoform X2 n=1 Tax=Argopecten irradians TaxID=31199 RepID=UPI003715CB80